MSGRGQIGLLERLGEEHWTIHGAIESVERELVEPLARFGFYEGQI